MLIVSIVTASVFAILFLFIHIYGTFGRRAYEYATKAYKSTMIFGYVIFCLSFFGLVAAIIFYFLGKFDESSLGVTFPLTAIFAIIGLYIIFGFYGDFAGVKGDEIHFRRYFKIQKVKIADVEVVRSLQLARGRGNTNIAELKRGFYDKRNNNTFYMDYIEQEEEKFINFVNARKAEQEAQGDLF